MSYDTDNSSYLNGGMGGSWASLLGQFWGDVSFVRKIMLATQVRRLLMIIFASEYFAASAPPHNTVSHIAVTVFPFMQTVGFANHFKLKLKV